MRKRMYLRGFAVIFAVVLCMMLFSGSGWKKTTGVKNQMVNNVLGPFGIESDFSGIYSITFLNEKGERGTDVSARRDKSVLAWMQYNEEAEMMDLYISADGDIIAPEDCSGLFYGYRDLKEIHFNDCFDTSRVTDMTCMFMGFGGAELDVSCLDTSNVTNMDGMFSYCVSLQKLDLRNFDTANVVDMSDMFLQNMELEALDVSSFDTSSVTDMDNMFYGCSALKKLDVSGFDTQHVSNMSDMFYTCSSLESLDVSSFRTRAVTDMSGMFYYLNVDYLDLRGFDFSKVKDASYMFFNCDELRDVDIGRMNLPKNANTEMMFENCPAVSVKEGSGEEPTGKWSSTRVSVGGTLCYPWVFDKAVENCTELTVHYQIVSVEYGKTQGTYGLYRKTRNNKWERIGTFEVKDRSEVTKTFRFDKPISFTELAVAAPSGRKFSFSSKMWFDGWEFQNKS